MMKMKLISGLLMCVCGAIGLAGLSARAEEPSANDLNAAFQTSDESVRLKAIDQVGAQGEQAAQFVEPLTGLLKDPSAAVRARAARALGEIGAPAKSAAPALVALLGDSEAAVRRQAMAALGAIRPGPKVAIPIFVRLLENADPAMRTRVMLSLAEAKEQAVPGLVEALKNEKAAYFACLVLREIGPAAKDAAPALVEKIKDPRPQIRREAILALASIGDAANSAIPQIAAALDDEHTRIAATFALGRFGKIPHDAEATIRQNVQGKDSLLGVISIWTLARVHPEDKPLHAEAVKRLIERMKDPNPDVRTAAARGLVAIMPDLKLAIPALRSALKEADEQVVRNALEALAGLGEPAVPVLIDALRHKGIRIHVAYILGGIGTAAAPAAEALAKLAEDGDELAAVEAVVAIGKIGPGAKAAVPTLVKLHGRPEKDNLHDEVAFALGQIGPDAASAESVLLKAVQSKDQAVALLSAWALARIEPASAENAARTVPVLTAGLAAPSSSLRQVAVEAMGQLGPLAKESAPAVEKLLADPDKGVRDAAAKALAAIRASAN